MIREVEGDILLSKAQVIAHGIAPQDPFDSGLALALRERWPSLVRDYRHAAHASAPAPGSIWAWSGVDADGSTRGIVNLLTQDMQGSGRSAKPAKASLRMSGTACGSWRNTSRERASAAWRCRAWPPVSAGWTGRMCDRCWTGISAIWTSP